MRFVGGTARHGLPVQLDGWYFLNRMFPGGSESEYDFLTLNSYSNKAASEKPYDEATLRKSLTETEIANAMNIGETRAIVRRETWLPLLRVESAP